MYSLDPVSYLTKIVSMVDYNLCNLIQGVKMFQIAKVCITVATGVGMCTTAPAWATITIVTVVTVGTVAVLKSKAI